MLKVKEIEAVTLVWGLGQTELEGSKEEERQLTTGQKEDLEDVLVEFEEVFREPQGLPPVRQWDHKILIKDGVDPMNVRPYRYPYVMKAEIESQVAEMLDTGIIRPSNSPYSSPIILVKKKDGS